MNQTDCHVEAFHRTVSSDQSAQIQLGFMRHLCPDAFRYLCQTDPRCASIAVRHNWAASANADPQLGWGDRQAVGFTLRKAHLPMLDGRPNVAAIAAIRAALNRYAPENLDLLESAP